MHARTPRTRLAPREPAPPLGKLGSDLCGNHGIARLASRWSTTKQSALPQLEEADDLKGGSNARGGRGVRMRVRGVELACGTLADSGLRAAVLPRAAGE